MSSCLQEGRWPVLPTSRRLASRRAKSRISGATRSSNRITSAERSARTALSVSSSGSPGPAPTRVTWPVALRLVAAARGRRAAARPSPCARARGPAPAAPGRRRPPRSAGGRRCRCFRPAKLGAPRLGGLGPAREARRQQRLDARADGLAEHRRRTVGGDADDQRRAVDDGAELEGAEGRLVDDVDRHAQRCGRRGEDGLRLLLVLGGGHHQGGAVEVRRRPRPTLQRAPGRRAGRRRAPPSRRRARGSAPRRWRRRPRAAPPSTPPPRCRR